MATATTAPMRQAITSYTDKYGTFREGAQLHADHPAVKARPEAWAAVGLTDDELGQARLALYRAREAANPTPDPAPGRVHIPGPIPPERRRVVVASIALEGIGFLNAGDVMDANDPIVKKFPKMFAKETI